MSIKKQITSKFDVKTLDELLRCSECGKKYIKIKKESSKYHSTYKGGCKHIKGDIRICVG